MELKKAERQQVKLRVGLSGPSGFGKTYSALLLGYGITGDYTKIAVIDTENQSASLYSHLGEYNTLNLIQPYSPEFYIKAIEMCEKAQIEVIILDSISHEWNGKGGCLDIHEKLGGRFQDWAKVTPRHQAFIDKILQSKCHIITTVRTKVDYSMDQDGNGKTKVTKHGLKEVTREGFEYELTVNFELINGNHLASASKDRTGLFANKPEFIINAATGKKLMKWCNNGAELEEARSEIAKCETVDGLRHIYTKYPNYQSDLLPEMLEKKSMIENVNLELMPTEEIIEQQQIIEDGNTKS